MPIITDSIAPIKAAPRRRNFDGDFWSKLKVNFSGTNTQGMANGWGKASDIGLPIVGGVLGGWWGGAAGAKLGVTAGNLANKGLNAWGADLLDGTDAAADQQNSTDKEERNDGLISMAGNLAGNISSGIADSAKSFGENKVMDEAIGGASNESLAAYLDSEGMDPALMSSVASKLAQRSSGKPSVFSQYFSGKNQNQYGWADLTNSLINGGQSPSVQQPGYSVPGGGSSVLPQDNPNSGIRFLDEKQNQMFPTGFAEGGVPLLNPYARLRPIAPIQNNGPGVADLQQTADSVKQFFADYLKSPNFIKRAQGKGLPPQAEADYRQIQLNKQALEEDLTGQGSRYNSINQTVFYDAKQAREHGFDMEDVLAHEFGHVAGGSGFDMLSPDVALLNKLNRKRLRDPIWAEGDQPHDGRPEEAKADIDILRYRLKKDGVYDTGTQDFTPEHLKKAKELYENNNLIQRLFKKFADPDLINVMNTVASNKQKVRGRFFDGGEPVEYEMYPESDKTTEDYYMVDKQDAAQEGVDGLLESISFGQARYGERIFDQQSNIIQKSIMRSNMSDDDKKLAIGEHVFSEIKTHPDFSGRFNYINRGGMAKGGVVTPDNLKPQVLAFQTQYNQWAKMNKLKPISIDGKFGPETKGAIEMWNKSNPTFYKFDTSQQGNTTTLSGLQFSDMTVDPKTDMPEVKPLDTNLPEQLAATRTSLENGTAPTQVAAPKAAPAPTTGKSLTPYQRQNLFGSLSDLATAGVGAVVGMDGIPRYTPTDEYLKMRDEVYANKDQGFSSEEQATINQGLQNNYATSVNTIKNITGGGGTAGAVLGSLNNASQQLDDSYLKTAVQNVLQKRSNYRNYQGAVMNDMAVDQNIFEQDREAALAKQQAGLTLMDRSLQNIADRQNFNEQYGPESNYSALAQSFLDGTQRQQSRASGIVDAYRYMLDNKIKGV